MHELALSQSIVDLVLERARAEGLRSVTRVALEVGAAAGVEPEALRFCFDVVVEDTMAGGAELVIERVPLRARCRSCRSEFEPARRLVACPECRHAGTDLVRGRELRVMSFEGE
jgi:hydrogenase nickel incorporation protein HypA/HybF